MTERFYQSSGSAHSFVSARIPLAAAIGGRLK